MKLKHLINVVLIAGAIGLVYLSYGGVTKSIAFEKTVKERYYEAINVLKDIRTLEEAYFDKYGKYSPTADSLIWFARNDSLPVTFEKGMLTDDDIAAGITEEQAIKMGKIIRRTTMVPVLEFPQVKSALIHSGDELDKLKYVPFTDNVLIPIDTATIQTGYAEIDEEIKNNPVIFVAIYDSVLFGDMMTEYDHDLEKLILDKTVYEQFPGVKFGNLDEITDNSGNWPAAWEEIEEDTE